MTNLSETISRIEALIKQDTEASITYAALEARLAIEGICYERLRIAHDYISHDDLKKWQPKDIVNKLIKEVDVNAATSFTFSIAKESWPDGAPPPTKDDYEAMDFLPLGTHVGFNPNKLGKLWNGLANVALHVSIPTHKDQQVSQYGDRTKIKAKVEEALIEIKLISEGTLTSSGIGEVIWFDCICGSKNRRRAKLLCNEQTINCINPECEESYSYNESDLTFERRVVEISCRGCGQHHNIPKKKTEKLPNDKSMYFTCEGEDCGETITVVWRLMQSQKANPRTST